MVVRFVEQSVMVVPEDLGCDAFLVVVVVVPGYGQHLNKYGSEADPRNSIGVVVPGVMVVLMCWNG